MKLAVVLVQILLLVTITRGTGGREDATRADDDARDAGTPALP